MDKAITATHEAGHVLAILVTSLRIHIEDARIYEVATDSWEGEVRLDGRDRNAVDPNRVIEFAKGIAGPLTQLHFYPDSFPHDLLTRIARSGTLLEATRDIVAEKVNVSTNWWPDLDGWIEFCKRCPIPGTGRGFLDVEDSLVAFLKSPAVESMIHEIGGRLVRAHYLGRSDLLSIAVSGLPDLHLPARLGIF